jgi:hypothetical protein
MRPGTHRLAVYGLSGAGKSTAAGLLARGCAARGVTAETVKIATPLLGLQRRIYALTGTPLAAGAQDQILLRTLAGQLRRINPTFLIEDFLSRTGACGASVVITDDLKDVEVDYPRLAAAEFCFLHVVCEQEVRQARLAGRIDASQVPESASTWGFDRIRANWTVENSTAGIEHLSGSLRAVLADLLP